MVLTAWMGATCFERVEKFPPSLTPHVAFHIQGNAEEQEPRNARRRSQEQKHHDTDWQSLQGSSAKHTLHSENIARSKKI